MSHARLVTKLGNCLIYWNPSMDGWQIEYQRKHSVSFSQVFYKWWKVLEYADVFNKFGMVQW